MISHSDSLQCSVEGKSSVFAHQCLHCGNLLTTEKQKVSRHSPFCCAGCRAVYQMIQSEGLGRYYEIKQQVGWQGSALKSLPAELPDDITHTSLHYLDDPEFLRHYALEAPENSLGRKRMRFYLEGVHCAACVWITEKVEELVPGVASVKLDLAQSLVTVEILPGGSFRAVAEKLIQIGYHPHPIRSQKMEQYQVKENRQWMIRIAVAGAGAGNIMLLAVSLYAGLIETSVDTAGTHYSLARIFQWVSGILYLPVFLYSGQPFFKSAWGAIRSRELSIDIPIVFGIVVGSITSYYNLISGQHDLIYFDSFASLIFLLLGSRFILRRAQQRALTSSHLIRFLTPSCVDRVQPFKNQVERIPLDQLKLGDVVEVSPNTVIPVDGEVVFGESTLNRALLTGEPKLEEVHEGSFVNAGTTNVSSLLHVKVSRLGVETRLGKILSSMEEYLSRKAPIMEFAQEISRYFVVAIFGILIALVVYSSQYGLEVALNRVLALAIIACPCTFALATPFSFTLSLGRLARLGILIKGADVIEALSRVRTIFIDKTGTITEGNLELATCVIDSQHENEIREAVYALEMQSKHPVARAIVHYLEPLVNLSDDHTALQKTEEVIEVLGRGMKGRYAGQDYRIERSDRETPSSEGVAIFRNEIKVGQMTFQDSVRAGSTESIGRLMKLGYQVKILSGDSSLTVRKIAEIVGVPQEQALGELSPEEKSKIVLNSRHSSNLAPSKRAGLTMMVGDGANDAVALAAADVGIAVQSGIELSLRAADGYLLRTDLRLIEKLLAASRETMHVVRRNFSISLIYNLIAIYATFLGKITPLLAAILMPAVSLVLFASALYGTRKMRKEVSA